MRASAAYSCHSQTPRSGGIHWSISTASSCYSSLTLVEKMGQHGWGAQLNCTPTPPRSQQPVPPSRTPPPANPPSHKPGLFSSSSVHFTVTPTPLLVLASILPNMDQQIFCLLVSLPTPCFPPFECRLCLMPIRSQRGRCWHSSCPKPTSYRPLLWTFSLASLSNLHIHVCVYMYRYRLHMVCICVHIYIYMHICALPLDAI